MSEPILNVALIGCGRISGKHIAALTSGRLPTRLVCVADIIEPLARKVGDQLNVPAYTDFNAMLEAHPEVDVVTILTPTGYHAEHVQEVARHGRHIIVEKPMALRLEDCDKMIEACEKNGCRLFVVKQNRFNVAVQAARKAFEEGRFGKPVMATVRVRWRRDQAYYDQADWRGTWALDGGVMAQQASHHIDLLHWFMGPAASVHCLAATRLMDIEVEDTAAAVIRFESGALGVFEATTATRPEDLEGSLSILGEKGSVVIGGTAVNRITTWKFATENEEDRDMIAKFSQDVPNVYGHGHLPFLKLVFEAILENKPGPVEGREARSSSALLHALYESAAQGGVPVSPGGKARHSRLGLREPKDPVLP